MKKILIFLLAFVCLTASACSGETPVDPTVTTDSVTTDAPATNVPTTDAPETDAPATDAPATDAPATDAPAPANKGCGSTVALSALAIVGVIGTALAIKKRD